ncbi:hypothetical protein IWX62_001020 [Arthrobacter sp. CAN_A1]
MITTLNHDMVPSKRADMHPARVVIGRGVWFGGECDCCAGREHRRWGSGRGGGGCHQGRAR